MACARPVVSTSIPHSGQRTYLYPVGSPSASVSTNGPSHSIVAGVVGGDSAGVVPVDSTPAGSDFGMLRPVSEARSGVLAHAPAISDRCPALLSYIYNRLLLSFYAKQNA